MGAIAAACAPRSCAAIELLEKTSAYSSSENGQLKILQTSRTLSSLQGARRVYLGQRWRSTLLRNSISWHYGAQAPVGTFVDRQTAKLKSLVCAEFRNSSSDYSSETSGTAEATALSVPNMDATPHSSPASVLASANGSAASDDPPQLDHHPAVLSAMTEYVIRVNAEMMGVFKYVEKMKRARIKDLAEALIQVAFACTLFTCVRGLLIPLIEIFSSHPPNWSKAVLMLAGLDYFAVAYLAFKAREPMVQAMQMAVVPSEGLEVLERQEEVMVTMLVELVKLFKRMRNVLLVIAFTQAAQAIYGIYTIKDPNFVGNVTAAITKWVIAPWS